MKEHESNKKKLLLSCAMKGKWDKVIELYEDDLRLHNARITRPGQTALHIAVSDGKENVVKQMLEGMSKKQHDQEEIVKALRTHDHRGNTALHLAASMGNATICRIIARVEATLVDDRNDDGETPLFLAALHGRKQAFLCLHSIRNRKIIPTTPPLYVNCRRNNGDTILHCAINGGFFDLAFQIIHLYEDLANSVNGECLSPLHLLASKPHAFKSGSRLGRIETIIYHSIHVEKLTEDDPALAYLIFTIGAADSDSHDCPDNYKTLWNVFSLIRKVVTAVAYKPNAESDAEDPRTGGSPVDGCRPNPLFPVNYSTCCNLIRFFCNLIRFFYLVVLLTLLGKGSEQMKNISRKKETHTWSVQVLKELLKRASVYDYEYGGGNPYEDEGYNIMSLETHPATLIKPSTRSPTPKDKEGEQVPKMWTTETPILVAAKNGVMEIIEEIVELFPVAIHDLNEDKKNMVLLAVEHRQPHVFEFLMKKNIYRESLFHQVDKDGNSALHWAATLGGHRPYLISGEALQMQWELKWYEFVKTSVPPSDFICGWNNRNETPDEIFTKNHSNLVIKGGEWLTKTSESCSVVAGLVVTVAFTTAATVPGGIDQDSGYPTLENEKAFNVFAISSLIALCCSVMALVTFLSLLASRFQERDFRKTLPTKLLMGLTLLLMSIASMLVSFCAGHYFVLKHQLHHAAFTLYALTCLAVIFYVLSHFPLYFDYLKATFIHVPQRGYLS